ncbi:MAG: 4-hydroxy-tetrahydrodipicolinate synthase [Bacteroidales bacterium]|jgi:4-hydroxy-tetrahydrodipicolinate synthase|nr:4-hydroxy-tetrahydrodipicolinate synthase [Bacteroidales bacterium]NLM91862.1 4-hydroxy-tetrahydrodipicolinate synthase [Bacteroidales bacterium]
MNNKLKGTGTAIVTPFHKEGNIDFNAFEGLIEYQINNGINYLVFMGTTGESVTLNQDERNAVINMAVEIVNGRVPVVIGMGGNNTQRIVNTIKTTDFEGIDAILSVSPYYNKPPQKGIFLHYKTIAGVSPVPVIIYNVPSRTGSNISAETTLKLAREVSNIVAVKEASRDLVQAAKIIRDRPDGFLVISGDDVTALPFMALGGDGVISVIANALPAEFSSMISLCLNNEFEAARRISYKLIDIIDSIYAEGSPSGVKGLLELKGLCQNVVRLPLVKANKALQNQMAQLLEKL